MSGIKRNSQLKSQLFIYITFVNRCNAKYLWKRIPQNVKNSHAELACIWRVGQKMWQRDFTGVYAALAVDWSENVGYIMQALLGELSSNRYLAQLPE
jgi:COP9 signalosome complex subunit 8